jgi:hypothetical protein
VAVDYLVVVDTAAVDYLVVDTVDIVTEQHFVRLWQDPLLS